MQRIPSPAGVTVSYDNYGEGPPLVLVHGSFSDHKTNWESVKPVFETQFTVYAIARRDQDFSQPRLNGPWHLRQRLWYSCCRKSYAAEASMKNDFYSKAVLTIIAVAMSIIALNPWIAPQKVEAAAASQDGVVSAILATVTQAANGSCRNVKICETK